MGIALRDIETQISVLIEMIDVQLFIQGDVNAADAFLNQTMEHCVRIRQIAGEQSR